MKKYIFFAGTLIVTLLLSTNLPAQKTEAPEKETKEIIIRKNGDKQTKTTIEINGDNITVNGKPLSEYHGDDVTVRERHVRDGDSHNFFFSPENDRDMDVHFFDDKIGNEGSRTFLGVISEKATDGVKITDVIKGSGAEKAGLQKDDIITSVNDKKITSPEDLMKAVRSYKPDDNIKIDYLRNNKKKDVKVKLGETKGRNRGYFFKHDNPDMPGNGFNFKMPKVPNLPDNFYVDRFWNNNPKLGIKIEDTENGSGAKIRNVEEGSSADKAGLKKDDIITEVNGKKVNNVDEIRNELNEVNDKESFNMKARRNNSEINFEIKISKHLNSADL